MQRIKFANPIPLKYTTVVRLKPQINALHAKHIFPVRKINLQSMLDVVTSMQATTLSKS
jgi:hypothetical protein